MCIYMFMVRNVGVSVWIYIYMVCNVLSDVAAADLTSTTNVTVLTYTITNASEGDAGEYVCKWQEGNDASKSMFVIGTKKKRFVCSSSTQLICHISLFPYQDVYPLADKICMMMCFSGATGRRNGVHLSVR